MTTQSIIDKAFARCERYANYDDDACEEALWDIIYTLDDAKEIILHQEDDDAYFMGDNGKKTYIYGDLLPRLRDFCDEHRGPSQDELDRRYNGYDI